MLGRGGVLILDIDIGGGAAQWVGALGSILAAGVAVGIAVWSARRERAQRPLLSLRYISALPSDFVIGTGMGGREGHVVRLRVENRPGRRSGDDVEVFVQSVVGAKVGLMPINTGPLRWSGIDPVTGVTPVTRITLPPGMSRSIDLLYLPRPIVHSADDELPEVLADDGDPATLRILLAPATAHLDAAGIYQINLAVTARDTDTARYGLPVIFDGQWWGSDKIREHLIVGPLRRAPRVRRRRLRWRHIRAIKQRVVRRSARDDLGREQE